MSFRWPVVAVACAALAAPFAPASATPATMPAAAGDAAQITELIVAYQPGVPPAEAPGVATGSAAVASDVALETGNAIGFGMRTIDLSEPLSESDAEALADELSEAPGVLFAEPNRVVSIAGTQTDPDWGLSRIDQQLLPLDAIYAYPDTATGAGVTAYVIDTGINSSHTEFDGRLVSGTGVTGLSGTDDCHGHGTHVAGIIGGTTYGLAKSVQIAPVRVLGCDGTGTTAQVIEGINWVVDDHTTFPAVANLSLGSDADTAMDTAVNAMIDDGITVVVASGNETADACNYSPARVPAAITVNASDELDNAASFSNYGSCTDIYAPGFDIESAWYTSDSATHVASGTSMAAPHVAGVAARILDEDPTLTPAEVWTRIEVDSTNIVFAPGSGDPDRLLFASPVAGGITPTPPRSVAATAGDTTAEITWSAPASNGGSAVTGYTATAWDLPLGGTEQGTCSPAPVSALACTIDGLVNDTTYYVSVIATNTVGDSTASSRASATPAVPVVTPPPASGGGSSGGSSGGSTEAGGGGGGSIWTVKEVRPSFGSKDGGDTVLVLGWGFTGATDVSVGGTLAPKFTFINDATIEIVTPPGQVGWQELRVWLPNGSVPAGFEYRDVPAAVPPSAPADANPPAQLPTAPVEPVRSAVGFAASPILRATAADLASTPITAVRARLTTRLRTAPVTRIGLEDVSRLRVNGLKKSTRVTARIRIEGAYYWLGRVLTTSKGNATLPGFSAIAGGTYPIRVSANGMEARYLTVRVR